MSRKLLWIQAELALNILTLHLVLQLLLLGKYKHLEVEL